MASLLGADEYSSYQVIELRQPGDLGVLRGVIRGFSEEARTRGFPSLSLGGFGFVVAVTKYSRRLSDCLIGNIIRTYSSVGNVRH